MKKLRMLGIVDCARFALAIATTGSECLLVQVGWIAAIIIGGIARG